MLWMLILPLPSHFLLPPLLPLPRRLQKLQPRTTINSLLHLSTPRILTHLRIRTTTI